MRSVSPTFIGCRLPLAEARIVVYGIPFEGRVNLRKGADAGTLDVRLGSESIETYSPALARDLEDLAIADIGDCELPDGAPPREQLDAAREQIAAWWRPGLIPFMLGGDHTATVSVIEVLGPAFPDLRILHLDAHPDLREEFLGERYNYAAALARVMDVVPPERVYQVGIRTGAREEYHRRRPHFFPMYPMVAGHPVEVVRRLLPELRSHPLYVTIDIDVLDPAEAPGTGSPEPGGLRAPEVVDIACGTGPLLMRLADRGYLMSGLDLSPRNIQFLRERFAAKGYQGELVVGDMTDFRLAQPVDAAICMQDSQGHLLGTEQLVAHLRAVAKCLKHGGLYVFDRYMASSWTNPARRWTWSKRRGRLIIRASFPALNDHDTVPQAFRERLT